ncbi:MAG: molybdenum cofactor guanylyltransferase [Acidobacteria bacterium]|nr:molybdenum cofactor guanylyltransferase [Acidobacteriota bacterium]
MPSARSSENAPSIAGFILAGGKSSRLGVDKAFLEFQGRSLLERAIETMREVCDTVSIVGDPAKFASYGAVVTDVYEDCGPLGGIHAALAQTSAEINMVTAVDMPFVSREFLAFLRTTAMASDSLVVVPRTRKGFQPLCALYRREFGAAAEVALRAGKYKIDAVFPSVSVRVIHEEELLQGGFSERIFLNINTQDDLRAAQSNP